MSSVAVFRDTYPVDIGSQRRDLPLVPVADQVAISLLMTIDVPLSFVRTAGEELAELLGESRPEAIVTAATLGIPIATEVARALGHDEIVVLQKTAKIHLADAFVEPLSSITTDGEQALRLDRARVPVIAGRRIAFVDDVIATGGSVVAALRLIRAGGGDVVTIGSILTEGADWQDRLDEDAPLVRSLGTIPVFRSTEGGWTPMH
ncbi:MAG: phosphoribosyltransferase family protein [Ilumatobacter sp.]